MDTERLVVAPGKAPPALGLFLLDEISAALENASWDVKQEVALYVKIAQSDGVNARVRLEAAEKIRQITKESAILQGYIQRLSMSQEEITDADGHTITSTRISGDRFMTDPDSTLAKLQAGTELHAKHPQLNDDRRAPRLTPKPEGESDANSD